MAEVTGSIGNEHVELNNAATEATLKLLLASVMAANKQSIEQVKQIATKAGLDPAAVKSANEGLRQTADTGQKSSGMFKNLSLTGDNAVASLKNFNNAWSPLVGQLIRGQASASDAFKAFEQLPGPLGVFMGVLGKVSKYQEENMATYQKITESGANLGGSLTGLRQSALNTYMTLDQFGNLIKNNSDAFSRMGGTVNDGVKAFTSFSKGLIGSDAGTELLALGFTTEQLNNGMASYIAATGGRNRAEMQDREKLTAGAKAYFEQLDALATITGVSREEQEKSMKERAANEAWQAHLQTLSVEERAKAEAAAAEARTRGGKGAEQALMSAAMGFPPMTKAAQEYTTLARNSNAATMNLVKDIKDSSKSVKDVQSNAAAITSGLAKDGRDNAQVFKALVMQGGDLAQTAGQALGAANKAKNQEIKSDADARAQLEQVQAEQRKRQADSQANEMAKTEKAMKQVGQGINDFLSPAISYMTKIVSTLTQGIATAVTFLSELNVGWKLLIAGTLAYLALKNKELILEKAKDAMGKGKDALSKVKGMVPGSTPANPLYVVIVKGGAAGAAGGLEDILDKGGNKAGDKGSKAGKGGKFGKLAGGLGGIAGGFALDYAGEKLKESGHEKLGATADVGSAALTGAGMGAMLGPIGALVGGLAGAAYGTYQNWGTLSGKKPMADGGIVNGPTNALVGEAGPEVVAPLRNFETLRTELETLNKQTTEMIRYLRETSEYSRRNNDALKSLSGDLFKF
jgi:hypothetical protein